MPRISNASSFFSANTLVQIACNCYAVYREWSHRPNGNLSLMKSQKPFTEKTFDIVFGGRCCQRMFLRLITLDVAELKQQSASTSSMHQKRFFFIDRSHNSKPSVLKRCFVSLQQITMNIKRVHPRKINQKNLTIHQNNPIQP